MFLSRRWFNEDHSDNCHLWDNDLHVVEWLETQVQTGERSTSQDSIKLIKKDSIINSLKNISPELIEDIGKFATFSRSSVHKMFSSGIYLAQKMSPEKRAEFIDAVENIGDRDEKSVSPSPSNTSEGETSP